LLSICGLLKAGPQKILSFKPVRSTKKVADPCPSWYKLMMFCLLFPF